MAINPFDSNFSFEEYAADLEQYTPTVDKTEILTEAVNDKVNKLKTKTTPITRSMFSDADTFRIPGAEKGTRIGEASGSYPQAPESPWTIENRKHRTVTDEDLAKYYTSKKVLDNYAAGVIPASSEAIQDLVESPLSAQDQLLYDRYIKDTQMQPLEATGVVGHEGIYGRPIAQVQNPTQPDTLQERLVQSGIASELQGTSAIKDVVENKELFAGAAPIDDDGMLGESVDIAQSSLIQEWGKVNKSVVDSGRWLGEKLGVGKDTMESILPDESGIFGKDFSELAQQEVADKMVGVMAKTREEQQAGMQSALENIKKGNYLDASFDTFKILPYMLGDSAGEMAAIAMGAPGISLAVAARVNEDAETYEKNNGEKPDAQWMLGSTLSNAAALFGERFLIKSGIGNIIEKGVSKAKRTGGVAISAIGEAAQEYYDQVQQEYLTQKEGNKSLEEIATSPEAQLGALAGGVMGGALRGAGEGAGALKDVGQPLTKKAVEATKEKVDQIKESRKNEAVPSVKLSEEYGDVETVKAKEAEHLADLDEAITSGDNVKAAQLFDAYRVDVANDTEGIFDKDAFVEKYKAMKAISNELASKVAAAKDPESAQVFGSSPDMIDMALEDKSAEEAEQFLESYSNNYGSEAVGLDRIKQNVEVKKSLVEVADEISTDIQDKAKAIKNAKTPTQKEAAIADFERFRQDRIGRSGKLDNWVAQLEQEVMDEAQREAGEEGNVDETLKKLAASTDEKSDFTFTNKDVHTTPIEAKRSNIAKKLLNSKHKRGIYTLVGTKGTENRAFNQMAKLLGIDLAGEAQQVKAAAEEELATLGEAKKPEVKGTDTGNNLTVDTKETDKLLTELQQTKAKKAAIESTMEATGNSTQKQLNAINSLTNIINNTTKRLADLGMSESDIITNLDKKKVEEARNRIKQILGKERSQNIFTDADDNTYTVYKFNKQYHVINEDNDIIHSQKTNITADNLTKILNKEITYRKREEPLTKTTEFKKAEPLEDAIKWVNNLSNSQQETPAFTQDSRFRLVMDAFKGKKVSRELDSTTSTGAEKYTYKIVDEKKRETEPKVERKETKTIQKKPHKFAKKTETSPKRPNSFEELPFYDENVRTFTYAGIGSRSTPKAVLETMTKVSTFLEGKGYTLNTGITFRGKEEGADKAFSDGTSKKKLFAPEEHGNRTEEQTIAKEIHPAPQYLKAGGLKLMARNTNQVFGDNLDTPVDFVLFYAEETSNPLRPKGGTGQAVEMARRKGIPTINMADKNWRKQLTDVLSRKEIKIEETKILKKSKVKEVETTKKKVQSTVSVDFSIDYLETLSAELANGKAEEAELVDSINKAKANIAAFDETLDAYQEEIYKINSDKAAIRNRINRHKEEIKKYKAEISIAKHHRYLRSSYFNQGLKELRNGKAIAQAAIAMIKQTVESIKKFGQLMGRHKSAVENLNKEIFNLEVREKAIESKKETSKEAKKQTKKGLSEDIEQIQGVQESIKAAEKELEGYVGKQIINNSKLQTELENILQIKKTKSKLASDPEAGSKVSKILERLNEAFSLAAIESIIEEKFIDLASTTGKGKMARNTETKKAADHDPARVFIGEDNKLHPNVVAAISKSLLEYLLKYGVSTLEGDQKQIAGMLGYGDNVESVPAEAYNLLRGKVFKKNLADTLGKTVMSDLGIKVDPEAEARMRAVQEKEKADKKLTESQYRFYTNKPIENMTEKMVASIGQIAAVIGGEIGIFTNVDTISEDNQFTQEKYAELASGVKIADKEKAKDIKIDLVGIGEVGQELVKAKDMYTTFNELAEEFFDGSFIKEVKTKPIKDKEVVQKVDAQVFDTPQLAKDVVNKGRKQEWRIDLEAVKLFKDEELHEIVKRHLGYMEESKDKEDKPYIPSLGFIDSQNQIAKNNSIELKLKLLDNMIERLGLEENPDAGLFYDYFYGSNGRYYLDNNEVNPQNDTFNRFMMGLASNEVEVDLTKEDADSTKTFYIALAQAMGEDIDKMKLSRSIELGKEYANMGYAGLIEKIKDPDFEPEAIGHALQGALAIKAKETAKGKPFKTNLVIETDAVTSGIILKLMQLPLVGSTEPTLESVKKLLKKGGVVFKGDEDYEAFTGTNELIANGQLDLYKTIAQEYGITIDSFLDDGKWRMEVKENDSNKKKAYVKDVNKRRSEILKITQSTASTKSIMPFFEKDGKKIAGDLRKIFKPVVMVFGYGGSIESIKRKFISEIVESLPTALIKERTENNKLRAEKLKEGVALKDIKTSTPVGDLFKYMLKDKNREFINNVMSNKVYSEDILALPLYTKKSGEAVTIRDILMDDMTALYATNLEAALKGVFGKELMEANKTLNNSFRMMFRIFNHKYQKRIQEFKDAKGYNPTEKDKAEILVDMKEEFPAVTLPLAKDTEKGVIVDKKIDASTQITAQTMGNFKRDSGQDTISVAAIVKEFEEAINAGNVVPIHYIDASIMGSTFMEIDGIAQVFDAIIGNMDNAKTANSKYNENAIKISREYSLTEKVLESLMQSIESLDKETELPLFTAEENLQNNEFTIEVFKGGETVYLTYENVRDSMVELKETTDRLRSNLFSSRVKSDHMTGLGAVVELRNNGTIIEPTDEVDEETIKDTEENQTTSYHASSEETDVAVVLKALGIKGTREVEPTQEVLVNAQKALIKMLQSGKEISLEAIEKVINFIDVSSASSSTDGERRSNKAFSDAKKYGGTTKNAKDISKDEIARHLVLQVIEELGEFIEQEDAVNVESNTAQKRILKTIRFMPNTVIKQADKKDSWQVGKTNLEVLNEVYDKSLETTDDMLAEVLMLADKLVPKEGKATKETAAENEAYLEEFNEEAKPADAEPAVDPKKESAIIDGNKAVNAIRKKALKKECK